MQPLTPSQVIPPQSKINAVLESINQAPSENKLISTAQEIFANLTTVEARELTNYAERDYINALSDLEFSTEEIEKNEFTPVNVSKEKGKTLIDSKISPKKPLNAIVMCSKQGNNAQILFFDNTDPAIREEAKNLKQFNFNGVTYNLKVGRTLSSDKIELFTRAYLIHQTATQILKIKESKEKEAQKEKKPEGGAESQRTYDNQETVTDNKKQDIEAEKKEAIIRKEEAQRERHQVVISLIKLDEEFRNKLNKIIERKKEDARKIEEDEIKRNILKSENINRQIKQMDLNSETTQTEEKIDAFFPEGIPEIPQVASLHSEHFPAEE